MGIQSEELRFRHKNQHLPTHDLSLNQTVMYQESVSKKWYPAAPDNQTRTEIK